MIKTLIGDPHIKHENLDKIDTLFDIVEELGNDVIVLGDTLDSKEIIRGKSLNMVFNRVSRSKLHWTFLIGNHCLFNLHTTEHSLQTLKALSNVTIVDEPLKIDNTVYFPYCHDYEQVRTWIKDSPQDSVLFAHIDVFGCDYGNGVKSDRGLQIEELSRFKQVISGHYHSFQTLKNITYLGTPFSHSFGETDQTKYIGIWDIETNKLELIETNFPQHKTYEIDCDSENKSELITNEKNYNRVILKGNSRNIAKYVRKQGIKYIEKIINSDKIVEVSETLTHEQQFVKWAEKIKKYDKNLIDMGLEILKDV